MKIRNIRVISGSDTGDETRLYVNDDLVYETGSGQNCDTALLRKIAMSLSRLSNVAVERSVVNDLITREDENEYQGNAL